MQKPIISADSHITEPPGTYVDRIDSKYKDTAPHMIHDEKLGDVFLVKDFPRPINVALAAAAALGLDAEIIDLRSLVPLDVDTMCTSVRKTGRCVVVHEAPVFCGFGAEVAARISHDGFDLLEAPVGRVGGLNVPYPPARYEKLYLPDVDRILQAADAALAYG